MSENGGWKESVGSSVMIHLCLSAYMKLAPR